MIPVNLEMLRQAFDEDDILWPYYIAYMLEEVQTGLALEWAIRCVTRLLPESGASNLAQLQIDLDNLTAWVHHQPTSIAYCPELIRDIWYYPGNVHTGGQRGMSNLYAAYHHHVHERDTGSGYKQAVGTPIQNFRWDTLWSERPDDLFKIIIEECQALLVAHGRSPI